MPFVENQFPEDTVPKDAIRTYTELDGQRLLKPLKAFQFVTRRDLVDDATVMAARTQTVTMENVSVVFSNRVPNFLGRVCSILWYGKGSPPFCHSYHTRGTAPIHHGLCGYVRFVKLHQENRAANPPLYGITLVHLEGVFAYIRLIDAQVGPDWWVRGPTYTVSLKVTPEEAKQIAQAQKKGTINICYLGQEPKDLPVVRKLYRRWPGPIYYFWDELMSGALVW